MPIFKNVDRENDTISQIFNNVYGYNKQYTPMKADLKGRVAIVTGAAGMIGGASALLLASSGAKIAIFDINDDKGHAMVEKIKKQGGEAKYYHVDVTDTGVMEAAVKQVAADYNRIDILFANAGINLTNRKPVVEMESDLFDRNIDVNLKGGTIRLTRMVLPYMIERGSGCIIYTSSVCGVTGLRKQCGFVASKFAISALTRSLALEYGKYGIRVNTLAPGSVPDPESKMSFLWDNCAFDDYDSNFTDPRTILFDIAARRPGHPRDMAGLVLYLASDDASYTTGQVICVDGGWTAGLSGEY